MKHIQATGLSMYYNDSVYEYFSDGEVGKMPTLEDTSAAIREISNGVHEMSTADCLRLLYYVNALRGKIAMRVRTRSHEISSEILLSNLELFPPSEARILTRTIKVRLKNAYEEGIDVDDTLQETPLRELWKLE